MPPLVPRVRCAECGASSETADAHTTCASCGGLLFVEHPLPSLTRDELRTAFERSTQASGVWRYQSVVHSEATHLVSWPEGNTPLIERRAVADFAGLRSLRLKHEGMNPTGSFKDRGMTVAISQAVRCGARAVACASTGNTSASLAAYASLAGLKGLVLVPSGQIALGKLTQTLAYGAKTLLVAGDFDACLSLVREASKRLGVYLVNSVNPWRLEGQKTIVFELLQQLNWQAPDWISLPAGNLGNAAAFGKALKEAREWGLIERVPRLLLVQARGAAPFFHSYALGFERRVPVKAETVATAIRIGNPASYQRGVEAVRYSGGQVAAVTDAEILEAKAVIDGSGVGCEPASAASVAGVKQLVEAGIISPGESVVAVLTGHVLKDPGTIDSYHRMMQPPPARANQPIEIRAELSEIERVLDA